MAAQFVLLKIETGSGSPTWGEWTRKYKYEGRGIPIVFVVRADGEQLFGRSGAIDSVPDFLALALKSAGTLLNARQLEQLNEGVTAARKLYDEDKIPEAVLKLGRLLGTGSFAEAAIAADKLGAELAETARTALQEAQDKLKADDTLFEGALALVETERLYGNLPLVKKEIGVALAESRKDERTRNWLRQAEALDKAQQLEAAENWKSALTAYQRVVADYPDTPAAELAAPKLTELEDKAGTVATAGTAPRTGKPQPAESADEKKAAGKLRLGKLLIGKNNPKAREYLQEVIELAPDSEPAEEARRLLEKL